MDTFIHTRIFGESTENLQKYLKAKKEEPIAVVIDELPQKQIFISIHDCRGCAGTSEEEKGVAN